MFRHSGDWSYQKDLPTAVWSHGREMTIWHEALSSYLVLGRYNMKNTICLSWMTLQVLWEYVHPDNIWYFSILSYFPRKYLRNHSASLFLLVPPPPPLYNARSSCCCLGNITEKTCCPWTICTQPGLCWGCFLFLFSPTEVRLHYSDARGLTEFLYPSQSYKGWVIPLGSGLSCRTLSKYIPVTRETGPTNTSQSKEIGQCSCRKQNVNGQKHRATCENNSF